MGNAREILNFFALILLQDSQLGIKIVLRGRARRHVLIYRSMHFFFSVSLTGSGPNNTTLL